MKTETMTEGRFRPGDRVEWSTMNGRATGVVMQRDGFGLGYMTVKMASGRRMLVHEDSARPASATVGHYQC